MTATVLANDMVAHVWAQQSQPEGRSHNGNFYFRGPTLFSYGSHYPVGIFAPDGTVFLNSSKSTPTTEGKHKNAARRALNYGGYIELPELDECAGMITAPHAGAYERAERYLSKHWQAIPADSEGAAWLLRMNGSRRTWATIRAGLERASEREKAAKALAERKAAQEAGKALSGRPIAIVRADSWIGAASYGQRDLGHAISEAARAHKATPPAHKRVRAAVWLRLKAMRAIKARAESMSDRYGNPDSRLRAHAALGRLRRFKAGLVAGPNGTPALEMPDGSGWRYLAEALGEVMNINPPMPPATRGAVNSLWIKARETAERLEGEAARKARITAARREALRELRAYNLARRWLRCTDERGPLDPLAPSPLNVLHWLRNLGESLDRLTHMAAGDSYPFTRWDSEAPAIRARLRSLGPCLQRDADSYLPRRDELQRQLDGERAAARSKAEAERDRISRMSDAERLAAWYAGQLSDESVRYMRERGPLLRAEGALVDGCNVVGGTLRTSMGATVPLRHAFRVFQFVAACRAEGKRWTPGAWGPRHIRVGHFSLDSVAASGDFVAGCHAIKWPEVAALAERLGVAGCLVPLPEAVEIAEGVHE